jgi:hypothetical protein
VTISGSFAKPWSSVSRASRSSRSESFSSIMAVSARRIGLE